LCHVTQNYTYVSDVANINDRCCTTIVGKQHCVVCNVQRYIKQLLPVEDLFQVPMAFAFVQITVYALFLYVLNTHGRVCHGNVTDDFVDDIKSLEAEHCSIHTNHDRTVESTTKNECINRFLSSSMNENDTDSLGDDVQSGVTTTITAEGDVVVSTNNQNSPTDVLKTHMNIGFGEIQMIQHDTEATQQRLIEMLLYMYNNRTSSNLTATTSNDKLLVPVECKMHHELCAYWAARGECEARPGT
jgi:hypothetical protein